jgi:hypothetical protein
MAKTSTKTNKIDNIGDLQTILANNLLDLVSKRTNGKLVEQDLQYSRTLISASSKIITATRLQLEYIKVKKATKERIAFLEVNKIKK